MERETVVAGFLEEGITLQRYLQKEASLLIRIADRIAESLRQGNRVLLFGNGGSAADAQHIAGELEGRFTRERHPLPAMALTTNTSTITAIANDHGYETIFARLVAAHGREGDVVIGLSTSGNSPNVLLGMEEARKRGMILVGFSGYEGKLKDIVDYSLALPSRNTPRIQEAHITAGHIICHLIEEILFPQGESQVANFGGIRSPKGR